MPIVAYAVGRRRGFAALQAIVEIAVADCAQGLVVEAGRSCCGVQIFRKGMQRAQPIRRGRELPTTGAEEFLIAVIDQRGLFACNDAAGMARTGHATIGGTQQGDGAPIPTHDKAIRRWLYVKACVAEMGDGFVKGDLFIGSRHGVQCWLEFVPSIPCRGCGSYTSSIVALAAMLRISQSELETLRQHAARSYPEECCGVLLGRVESETNHVLAAVPMENVAAVEERKTRYQIAPEELIRLQRTAREQGMQIVGFYHSHPEQAATWSHRDWDEAHWTGCSYIITSVYPCTDVGKNVHAQSGETRSFRLGILGASKQLIEEEIAHDAA